jgi:hypothetical protein
MTALWLARLKIKTAQERLPQAVHLTRSCAGTGGPQPHGLRGAVTGQVIDLQADQGSLDDRQRAVVIEPGGAVGEPGVHPVPRGSHRRPVPGRHRCRGDLRVRACRRIGEGHLAAVLAGAAHGAGLARRHGQPHHPVAAQPPEQFHGQVREQPGEPGDVVAGVEDDQDPRITLAPVPGLGQPGHDLADLGGGHRSLVVIRAKAHGIQHRGPRGTARLQRRDHRVRPARDHLRLPLPAAIDVAKQPARAGGRAGPQPVTHIGREHQAAIRSAR